MSPGQRPLFTRGFIAVLATQSMFGLAFACFLLLPTFLASELAEVVRGAVSFLLGSVGGAFGSYDFPLLVDFPKHGVEWM